MTKEEFLTLRWSKYINTGIRTDYADLCWFRYIHISTVRCYSLYRACAYRGCLLNGCRTAFKHVVRMVKQRLRYDRPVKKSLTHRLVYIAYNIFWWIPIALAITKIIDYRTAFIALFVLTALRAVVNLYRNNVLNPEQAESFPLRAV